jgi:hypothetical protein
MRPRCQQCKRELDVDSITGTHGLCCDCVDGGFPLERWPTTPRPWVSWVAHWGRSDITYKCSESEWDGNLMVNGEMHLYVAKDLAPGDAELIVAAVNAAGEPSAGGDHAKAKLLAIKCDKLEAEVARLRDADALREAAFQCYVEEQQKDRAEIARLRDACAWPVIEE